MEAAAAAEAEGLPASMYFWTWIGAASMLAEG